MQENFEDALKAVLVHEGGFVTHPDDPGGATNRGVTLTVFQRHFPGADVDALRGITDGQVANIYHVDYWSACRCDELAAGIDYAFFDQAMNSGPSRSIRWLQQAVDAGVDGVIGPETIRLANAASASVAVERMCDERLSFMQAPRGGRQRTIFGRGVLRKCDSAKPRLPRAGPSMHPIRLHSSIARCVWATPATTCASCKLPWQCRRRADSTTQQMPRYAHKRKKTASSSTGSRVSVPCAQSDSPP